MLKILVTYAVPGEFAEIKWPDVEVYYVRTGIGKAKAAFRTSDAIQQVHPDLVINMGSATTAVHRVGDILACRRFIDRDMRKLSVMGIEYQLDSSALLDTRGFCRDWKADGTCNSGDSLVSESIPFEGDVMDMEAYALALVCIAKEVPFISVKYVSRVIGQDITQPFDELPASVRAGLSQFFNEQNRGAY